MRIQELEAFMQTKGFKNIDPTNGFVYMYQMFLVVFIRQPLLKDVSRVTCQKNAKGKNILFTVVGNKGGLCYSFVLGNRVFNIIGCHLQHK